MPWIWELCKFQDIFQLDICVDLRQLLEEASQDDLLKRDDVLLHLFIGANLRQNWRDLLADDLGMEVGLEYIVKVADLGPSTLKDVFVESIFEKDGASWRRVHAEQIRQASILIVARSICVDEGTTRAGGTDDWDRKRR